MSIGSTVCRRLPASTSEVVAALTTLALASYDQHLPAHLSLLTQDFPRMHPSPPRLHRRGTAPALTLWSSACILAWASAAVCLAPAPAWAEEGELAWSVGASTTFTISPLTSTTDVTRVAPMLRGAVRYGLSDFWEIGGELQAGVGLGGGLAVEAVSHLLLDVRLTLDALTWVPYLCAGGGALFRSDGPAAYVGGSGPAFDATLHIGVGVDYRPRREWSVGLVYRQHFVLSDLANNTGPMDITVMASFYSD